ncbi:MAG TPA: hypothetical protein PK710_23880, partial [Polyangiaceae bacterium]|nr:hypothetical protein [Polyangiaceae bacterium]
FATAFPEGHVEGWPESANSVVRLGLQISAACSTIAALVSFFGYGRSDPLAHPLESPAPTPEPMVPGNIKTK